MNGRPVLANTIQVAMAKKPHEIVVDVIHNAAGMLGLAKERWTTPEEKSLLEKLKAADLNKTFRKEFVTPAFDAVTRLKAQFDKRILKK